MKSKGSITTREVRIPSRDGKRIALLKAQWNSSITPETLGRQLVLKMLDSGHAEHAQAFMQCPETLGAQVMGLPRSAKVPKRIATTPPMRVDEPQPGHSVRLVTAWTDDGLPKIVESFHA